MSVSLTFHGHATMMLTIDGTRLLIDPFFSGNPQATVSADQVEADYILVSHGHGDHVGDLIPIAQRTGAKVITNFEIANWLQGKGVSNVHGQHLGGGFNHPFGYLKLTIAHHGSGLPDGSYGGNPAGFLLRTGALRLYFACDTALFSDMQLYAEEGLDLAVLPIGDNFTMGPDDALRAAEWLKAKHYVPVHYNTWPPIAQDGEAWCARVRTATGAKASALKPGESLTIP